ncbi:MAG: hypothetical protein AAF890_02530 [Pseudomonadota bacterium]
MTEQERQTLEDNMASIIKLAMDMGVFVEVGSDFQTFVDICRNTDGKSEVSPAFNPNQTDIDGSTGIWMVGRDANDRVVYAQAIKLLPLRGRTLEHYLDTQLGDISIGGLNVDVESSTIAMSKAVSRVAGKVTYHGEVWMHGDLRGGALTIILSRLILIMAYMRWTPDFMIGIQAFKVCCRGLGVRQGYARNQPGFVNWMIEARPDPIAGWLVWMTGEEASYNLAIPPRDFVDVFEQPKKAAPQEQQITEKELVPDQRKSA